MHVLERLSVMLFRIILGQQSEVHLSWHIFTSSAIIDHINFHLLQLLHVSSKSGSEVQGWRTKVEWKESGKCQHPNNVRTVNSEQDRSAKAELYSWPMRLMIPRIGWLSISSPKKGDWGWISEIRFYWPCSPFNPTSLSVVLLSNSGMKSWNLFCYF